MQNKQRHRHPPSDLNSRDFAILLIDYTIQRLELSYNDVDHFFNFRSSWYFNVKQSTLSKVQDKQLLKIYRIFENAIIIPALSKNEMIEHSVFERFIELGERIRYLLPEGEEKNKIDTRYYTASMKSKLGLTQPVEMKVNPTQIETFQKRLSNASIVPSPQSQSKSIQTKLIAPSGHNPTQASQSNFHHALGLKIEYFNPPTQIKRSEQEKSESKVLNQLILSIIDYVKVKNNIPLYQALNFCHISSSLYSIMKNNQTHILSNATAKSVYYAIKNMFIDPAVEKKLSIDAELLKKFIELSQHVQHDVDVEEKIKIYSHFYQNLLSNQTQANLIVTNPNQVAKKTRKYIKLFDRQFQPITFLNKNSEQETLFFYEIPDEGNQNSRDIVNQFNAHAKKLNLSIRFKPAITPTGKKAVSIDVDGHAQWRAKIDNLATTSPVRMEKRNFALHGGHYYHLPTAGVIENIAKSLNTCIQRRLGLPPMFKDGKISITIETEWENELGEIQETESSIEEKKALMIDKNNYPIWQFALALETVFKNFCQLNLICYQHPDKPYSVLFLFDTSVEPNLKPSADLIRKYFPEISENELNKKRANLFVHLLNKEIKKDIYSIEYEYDTITPLKAIGPFVEVENLPAFCQLFDTKNPPPWMAKSQGDDAYSYPLPSDALQVQFINEKILLHNQEQKNSISTENLNVNVSQTWENNLEKNDYEWLLTARNKDQDSLYHYIDELENDVLQELSPLIDSINTAQSNMDVTNTTTTSGVQTNDHDLENLMMNKAHDHAESAELAKQLQQEIEHDLGLFSNKSRIKKHKTPDPNQTELKKSKGY